MDTENEPMAFFGQNAVPTITKGKALAGFARAGKKKGTVPFFFPKGEDRGSIPSGGAIMNGSFFTGKPRG